MTIHPDALADTIPAACARLGIGRTALYAAAARGEICLIKAGGRTLCTREAQAAWLNSLPALHDQRAA